MAQESPLKAEHKLYDRPASAIQMGIVHSHAPQPQSLALSRDILFVGTMHLDMKDLSILADVNHELRSIVKEILSVRFMGPLSKFISRKHTSTFKSMLNDTRSVVGGSIAQAIITPRIFDVDSTSNLNIFGPAGSLHVWEAYLATIGYTHTWTAPPKVNNLTRTTQDRTVIFSLQPKNVTEDFIMVCEACGSSALTPILGSLYTSQMNFITADYVYSIYPVLTQKMKTLAITQPRPTINNLMLETRLNLRGIEVVSDKDEQALCNNNSLCRCVVRFLGKDRKDLEKAKYTDLVGIMCWGNDKVKERFLHEKRIRFWLGGSCRNGNCMYKTYFDDRLHFDVL